MKRGSFGHSIALGLALFCGAAVTAMAGTTPTPTPQQAERVTARYDFYVGGFSIAEITIDANLNNAGYAAQSQVRTRGVLEFLMKGRVSAQARGAIGGFGRLEPGAYATDYSSRAGARSVEIAYRDRNPATISMNPPEDAGVPMTPKIQQAGTLDPLSAAVAALTPVGHDSVCNRTIPVFDGARRYDVIFVPPRPERSEMAGLAPVWDKPLIHCLGVYERIAGFDADMLRNKRYFPFDIWFEDTGDGVYRAVRLAGKTRLGFAIGNLRTE